MATPLNILTTLRQLLVTSTGLAESHVLLLAGEPDPQDGVGGEPGRLSLGDRFVVVSPSEFKVDTQIQDGAGRYALFLKGVVKVIIYTRTYSDNILQDTGRLLDTARGSIVLANTITNAVEQYFPKSGDTYTFAEPARVSSVQFAATKKGFSKVIISVEVSWTQDLD